MTTKHYMKHDTVFEYISHYILELEQVFNLNLFKPPLLRHMVILQKNFDEQFHSLCHNRCINLYS